MSSLHEWSTRHNDAKTIIINMLTIYALQIDRLQTNIIPTLHLYLHLVYLFSIISRDMSPLINSASSLGLQKVSNALFFSSVILQRNSTRLRDETRHDTMCRDHSNHTCLSVNIKTAGVAYRNWKNKQEKEKSPTCSFHPNSNVTHTRACTHTHAH